MLLDAVVAVRVLDGITFRKKVAKRLGSHYYFTYLYIIKLREMKVEKKYAGFKVLDTKNQKEYEFPYFPDQYSVATENIAIEQLMDRTGLSRGNFWVSGLIKKQAQ